MIYKGSFGIVTYQNKALLLLRDDNPEITSPNSWCFIGGGDEEGETYEQTFLREAEEEIGVRPTQAKYLKIFEFDGNRYGVFTAELTDEEAALVVLGDEGQKLEYFTYDQMLEMPMAQTHKAFIQQHDELLRELAGGASS